MDFSVPPPYLWTLTAGAVAVVAGLAWLLVVLERRRDRRLEGFAQSDLLVRLIAGRRPSSRVVPGVLVLLGVALLFVALAGPRWGSREFTGQRGSRDILVLLDTSESMNANNPPPDRMTRAREKVFALMDAHPADRFGLVAFSGAAALQCPLTTDHDYFKMVLQAISTDTLTAEGTDIEAAFVEAENVLRDVAGQGRGATAADRVILLISDGETVRGDAVAAAGRMADLGHVVVMGIGDPEGAEVTLPMWMQRSQYGHGSTTHWSVLDEEQLAEIAVAGGGVYVRSTLGNDDLKVIAREMAFMEGYGDHEDARLRTVNQYRWPLAAAFACFALEALWLALTAYVIAGRRRAEAGAPGSPATSNLIALVLVFLACTPASADSIDTVIEQSAALAASGQAVEALRLCQEARVENPDSTRLLFAIGTAHAAVAEQQSRQNDSEDAASHWRSARDAFAGVESSGALQPAAAFNAATCLIRLDETFVASSQYEARLENLREAVAALASCRERYPDDERVRKNLDHARYKLALLIQNPPDGSQPEEEQGGDEPAVTVEVTNASTEIQGATAEVVDGGTVVLKLPPGAGAP